MSGYYDFAKFMAWVFFRLVLLLLVFLGFLVCATVCWAMGQHAMRAELSADMLAYVSDLEDEMSAKCDELEKRHGGKE